MATTYLCVHGHFYQPPRQNPFSGLVDHEPGAAPYHDFNEKIWDECYRPNAEEGNFGHMSFDIGPTLSAWLQAAHPATLRLIANAARAAHERTGHGNALAHAYHHTILPLATRREKRLQIAWGIRDFRRVYGYAPEGMWLPEAAVDGETLEILAGCGITHVILAPWQAERGDIDPTEPYRVELGGDRSIAAFFYNSPLSGGASFNDDMTSDAVRFTAGDLAAQVNGDKKARGEPQIILIATDGELYGHHKKFRDLFLRHLLDVEAPAQGYAVTSPGAYLAQHPPLRTAEVREATSWSCAHGVARWSDGCSCTEGDSSWKPALRAALRGLATRIDDVYEAGTDGLLCDPWAALEEYLDLRDGATSRPAYWAAHGASPLRPEDEARLNGLLEMQVARQAMFVSCAWFFEDVDRIEPRIALTYAHRAITLARQHGGVDLAPPFTTDLAASRGWRTGRSAADIYAEFAQAVSGVA